MSDISNPDKPTAHVEGSVDDKAATKENDDELHSGSGASVEGQGTPSTKGKTEEQRKESRERLKTVFIILAFVVSCFALGLSYLSYSTTNRAATAAEKALKTTSENFQRDQRAWVGPRATIIPPEMREGISLVFGVEFVNSGKTPAINTRGITAGRSAFKGDPLIPQYPNVSSGTGSKTVLQQGATTQLLTPPIIMTPEQRESLMTGESIFYIYGELSYEDVFGGSHCTMYCSFLSHGLRGASPCGFHNETKDGVCRHTD